MLKRIMGFKVFGELYTSLFGLEIMIDVNILKYKGQYPRLIYVLVILMMFEIHLLLVISQNELLTYLWYLNLGCTLRGLGVIQKFNNDDNDD